MKISRNMRKTILYLIGILLSSLLTYALNDTFSYQDINTPASGSINLTINIDQPNHYVYLTLLRVNESLNITHLPHQFYNETTAGDFQINYSLSRIYPTENTSILKAVFNISNDYNNVSNLYELIFIINKTIVLADIPSRLETITGGSNVSVTISNELIPFNGSQIFNVEGNNNSLVIITQCDNWLTCPANFTLNSAGKYALNITYFIPINTTNGTYQHSFELKYENNNTKQATFLFTITLPEILWKEYIWKEECFANETSMIECSKEFEQFQNQKIYDIYRRILEQRKNQTYIKEIEKLVNVGSFDPTLMVAIEKCQNESYFANARYQTCTIHRDNLIGEKTSFKLILEEMLSNITKKEQKINETYIKLAEYEKEQKEKTIKTIIYVLSGLVILTIYLVVNKQLNGKWAWEI